MPEFVNIFDADVLQKYKAAASIFGDGTGAGYILIALIAFVLGVCITVFCYRIRRYVEHSNRSKNDQEEKNDRIY